MIHIPAKLPDERTPRRLSRGRHPGRRVRWRTLLLRHLLAPRPHRRRLAKCPQSRPELPATPGEARRSTSSPGSRTDARLSRVNHPPRGHARGHSCASGSHHPLPLALPLPPFPPLRLRKPHGTVAVRSHTPEPHSPPRGGEWGRERPPSDLPIYGPETRSRASTSATARGSLPARADGAIYPCGKAGPG